MGMNNARYELTCDGENSVMTSDELTKWMAENFDPEESCVWAVRELKAGQSYGENLDGFNGASWLVRRSR